MYLWHNPDNILVQHMYIMYILIWMFRHLSCIIYITQIIFFNSYFCGPYFQFVLIMDFSHYYILYCISILHPCALIGFFYFLHHFFFALALHIWHHNLDFITSNVRISIEIALWYLHKKNFIIKYLMLIL